MKKQTCEFVPFSEVLPKGWAKWFSASVLKKSPFSWGKDKHVLVTGDAVADWVEEHYEVVIEDYGIPKCAFAAFMGKLRRMGQTYIDLEN